MRIVFLGAVDFSRHCLEQVIKSGGDVVGVITLHEDLARRHADYADLGVLTEAHNLPLYRINKINDNIDLLQSLQPDVIFVFGWSQLIANEILHLPRLGCIGTHPALLPKNRGRHPLIWALVEGLEQSGLTFMYLDEGADSGDILWQRPFPITLEDDAATLYEKIKTLAAQAIAEFVPQLQAGTAPRIPQDHTQATYWRKRGEKDGEVNWAGSSLDAYNLIRALTHPYVGAHTLFNGDKLLIWRARLADNEAAAAQDVPPGTIIAVHDGEFDVRTGDGYLTVTDYTADSEFTPTAGLVLGQ